MNLLDEFSKNELKVNGLEKLPWWNIYPLPWDWSRGAKTERYYNFNSEEAVENRRALVNWVYTYDDEINKRKVVDARRFITFFAEDGVTPILGPQDISKPFNAIDLSILNKEIRVRRISDLKTGASEAEGGVDLFNLIDSWYHDEFEDYYRIDALDRNLLENALSSESDPTRLAYLNAPISAPGTTFDQETAMRLLTFQLVGRYEW